MAKDLAAQEERKPTYTDLRDALSMAVSVFYLGDSLTLAAKEDWMARVREVLRRAQGEK